MDYEVFKFETDSDDASKTKIGIKVTNDNGDQFYQDTVLTTGSKSDDDLMKEAHTAIGSDVTEWQTGQSNIGKIWDADTNSFVENA